MEIVEDHYRPYESIPIFSIKISDFIDLLNSCPIEKDAIEIVIEKKGTSQLIRLRGIDNIDRYRDQIKTPFKICYETLRINVGTGKPLVHFDLKTEHVATALKVRLSEFWSWQNLLLSTTISTFLAVLVTTLSFIVAFGVTMDAYTSAAVSVPIFIATAIGLVHISLNWTHSRIILRERQGFFGRNRDNILLTIFGVVFGIIAKSVWDLIQGN